MVQFLSWEGSFVASNGPAAGMTSVDVGVLESGSENGTSIGLVGTGDSVDDFSWALIANATAGDANAGQSFGGGGRNNSGTRPRQGPRQGT